jgi:hypothetical protein
MSVLAFKAIGYGAEQIPDRFFEKIPGGFFTPAEKKKIKDGRDKKANDKRAKDRHQSEDRSSRRTSRRDRSPQSDYADDSAYGDSSHEREREQRRRDRRRRAKSAGRASSRSMSRGRHTSNSGFDGSDPRDMAERGQGSPYFPPPPTSEYTPYNPQEYASTPAQGEYRPSSISQPYGYPPQVHNFSRFRSSTVPMMSGFSTPVNASPGTISPMFRSQTTSNLPTSPQSPMFPSLSRGTPVSASFSPSTEPPLAALFARPLTNTPKPAQAYPAPPLGVQSDAYSPTFTPNPAAAQSHGSASAARYTPGPGYAPSPMMGNAVPVVPVAVDAPYPPYNPADFASARSGAYDSPPPLNRHRSNSQPSYAGVPAVPYSSYVSPSADQRLTAYDADAQSPSRRSSTKPRREHRHRARSADTHSSSRRAHTPDRRRDSSRMTKVRERFDDKFDRMDSREKGLAATVGGALAGGLAGRQMGKSTLTTLAGVAAGALGGRAIVDQKSK